MGAVVNKDDGPTGTTTVQNWMVQLAVWGIGVLGLGAIGTIVSIVNWCFWMQHEIGEGKRRDAAADVKIADLVSMANAINGQLREFDKKMDRIEAKMDRIESKMP